MNSASPNQPFSFSSVSTTAAAAGGMPSRPRDVTVKDTRREISEIVREVATAVRSDRSKNAFFVFLTDRILRAMAAEGVVIWQRDPDHEKAVFEPVCSLGRITQHSIDPRSLPTHSLMLDEVAAQGQPVVVPSTPSANDPGVAANLDVPTNPTDVPAAVVPIESDPSNDRVEYLIEVFLDPEGGLATQRGYLRFAAQMADLAGEFLRVEQLRGFRRGRRLGLRVDQAVVQLHRPSNRRQVEAAIVDTAAEVFGFDRVGLCIIDKPHTTLAAVSHVNQVDQRSAGAEQLRESAQAEIVDGIAVIDHLEPASEDAKTTCVVVAPTDQDDGLRLVALGGPLADGQPIVENKNELVRFINHANVAFRNANRLESIPGAKLFSLLGPALHSPRVRWWMRPVATVTVLTLLIIVAMFPLPLYVHSPATIHPIDVQQLTAPRDALVQQIHVQHGQSVLLGEPIVTLYDSNLDQQITNLIGRRSVLIQKRTRWTALLVDANYSREQSQQLEGEQSLVNEEIDAIDAELEQLRQSQSALVIRADRSGVVNAWRVQERLDGRPLMRGDAIAQIIANETPWVVDVQVAQNRIDHLQRAQEGDFLDAVVSLEATPHERFAATFQNFGPTLSTDGIAATSVRLQLSDQAIESITAGQSITTSDHFVQHSDAPARAVFHCGHRPAAYLLLQDVIKSVRGSLGLYLGIGAVESDKQNHQPKVQPS